jgi:tetratricopeptide (TPR) repeat protein
MLVVIKPSPGLPHAALPPMPSPRTPIAPRADGPGTERQVALRPLRLGTTASALDAQGHPVSGANAEALAHYERAAAAFRRWQAGSDEQVAAALRAAPGFVMAHVLRAHLLLCSRDPASVRSARPVFEHARRLPVNEREQRHLDAIAAAVADDYEGAKSRLAALLERHPRDLLALQVAHAFDYLTGETLRLRDRVAAVLPAWPRDLPGRHAVLAMHAFGLQECADYDRARGFALEALAQDPGDARACHVMAHVFEMTGRADEGLRWMQEHAGVWGGDSLVAVHGWWHVALFHLAQGDLGRALALYDSRIRGAQRAELAHLIDAASLLWRLTLQGVDPGARWAELTTDWAAHIDDGFCSFSDLHAMLAFVGARDRSRADALMRSLLRSAATRTRHGQTTRDLGLPACRALAAFDRGDDRLAITLLASLPGELHRLGGSHAQRDVLRLTLLHAVQRSWCAVA